MTTELNPKFEYPSYPGGGIVAPRNTPVVSFSGVARYVGVAITPVSELYGTDSEELPEYVVTPFVTVQFQLSTSESVMGPVLPSVVIVPEVSTRLVRLGN